VPVGNVAVNLRTSVTGVG